MTVLARPVSESPPNSRRHPLRGRPGDPRWVRPVLLGLLAATALLYLVGLGSSGWANAFYSAAAQAGGESWKALFFGSSDPSNAITVDKTPASLWVMGLSVRIFGLSSWSILVPEALMGVASVGLLYVTVRRVSGPRAGLLAGGVLALTPVAALMFRFNNPDALMVLLLIVGAYATLRAAEKASPKWLALAGVAVGFGFLAKMLQAFLVLPAFGLAYLVAAPASLGKRFLHLFGALVAMLVSAGWYIAVVELWPTWSRPFIGGSQTNSILELAFGYNGFGRITGDEVGSLGGAQSSGSWARLFGSEMAGGIAWLLPAAVLALGALIWLTWRAPRTDLTRASAIVWGGWLVITGGVFSYMSGIIHPYYTVALAPAVAALVGAGADRLWRERSHPIAAGLLSSGVALSGLTAYLVLLNSDWQPWLKYFALVLGLGAAALVVVADRLPRPAARGVAVLALVAALAGPAGYTVATAATSHTGAIPSAGPNSSGFGGGGGGGPRGNFTGGMPGGGQGGGRGGGIGSLLTTSTPSQALVSLLQQNSGSYRWAAATVGSNPAASYQLAADVPVMAVGGFNGTDPAPTLAQFQELVKDKEIHYFVGSGSQMGGSSGSDDAQEIAQWVAQNFTATTVDGTTVYDLTT
ncbi:4-amino-4-deoxy-L-arabinose transferase-like glycosyltransferase [Amycolatopsis bartoniae]|uniref:Glycosyl transferase n=1 Tax=Amycolatopsis bartoniae TaxID=941986 RepID=A0A8H9IUJ3_9PSEU|nr:glycosyltransferase family 39 protein [Amycolatopsis bartoniae]MBB2935828.1 4-amino-4-deoxy-L-arabinose transferase-like glycosyltransferase [Amycolatopsis bartoniae]TVT04966.1 glycosyltransferase family 39 protein [Amycolatopsis bartoniae]GHF62136.1 glycosyl transferase [Amycolatopsis bartoniae]